MTGHRSKLKGFKVSKTKTGKTILEPVACYGKDASARIRQAKSQKERVVRRTAGSE